MARGLLYLYIYVYFSICKKIRGIPLHIADIVFQINIFKKNSNSNKLPEKSSDFFTRTVFNETIEGLMSMYPNNYMVLNTIYNMVQ